MKQSIQTIHHDAAAVAYSSRKAVLLMGLKVLVYSLVLAGVTQIILLDAQVQDEVIKFSEQSYTEYAQELFLALSVALFYLSVRLFPKQAAVGHLMGGFLGMALIREYDAFLDDHVADGAWQVMAYSLAALTAFMAYREHKQFWKQLEGFIQSRAFGIIITGMIIVFIFSRLYGNTHLWSSAMGEDNYRHIVTRASEEGIELLGYAIIMLGALEHISFLRMSMQKKLKKVWLKKKQQSRRKFYVSPQAPDKV
ncbi:hypothetical protein [Pontibacter sp. SGAir0037]|uniref:hypothetical protein n=1 Tax=Pontibacter sp. SGAir0037 TaxID=2571030 RepID=UPI0010CD605D|nr:hypothetical protein [Pontibacter sp. SGAir0037]QCR21543.1 hypothetical protein C1N53_03740 [Pontibacter sp. SGAir0037]